MRYNVEKMKHHCRLQGLYSCLTCQSVCSPESDVYTSSATIIILTGFLFRTYNLYGDTVVIALLSAKVVHNWSCETWIATTGTFTETTIKYWKYSSIIVSLSQRTWRKGLRNKGCAAKPQFLPSLQYQYNKYRWSLIWWTSKTMFTRNFRERIFFS